MFLEKANDGFIAIANGALHSSFGYFCSMGKEYFCEEFPAVVETYIQGGISIDVYCVDICTLLTEKFDIIGSIGSIHPAAHAEDGVSLSVYAVYICSLG